MIVRDEWGNLFEIISISTETNGKGTCVLGNTVMDQGDYRLTEYHPEKTEVTALIDKAYAKAIKQAKGYPGLPFILDFKEDVQK